MEDSVWNTEIITSFFLFLLHIAIFIAIVVIIIYFIKKINSKWLKIFLAILPFVIIIFYTNFTSYFFTETYLKSYTSKQIEHELRHIIFDFDEETIVRNGNQYQYTALVSSTINNNSQKSYIYRVYERDMWKFTLIGTGDTGDEPPGLRFDP